MDRLDGSDVRPILLGEALVKLPPAVMHNKVHKKAVKLLLADGIITVARLALLRANSEDVHTVLWSLRNYGLQANEARKIPRMPRRIPSRKTMTPAVSCPTLVQIDIRHVRIPWI